MKNLASCTLVWVALLLGVPALNAQNSENEEVKVTKRTYMERFEPRLIKSVEERLALKQLRIAEMRKKMRILDSLDISERRRRALQNDLHENPFSHRLSKTWADIDFTKEEE